MRLGTLSAKYESSGDPGSVSQNPNDAGGWSYGIYQFSSAKGVVQAFVEWLTSTYWGYETLKNEVGDPRNSENFVTAWKKTAEEIPEAFGDVQDQYAVMQYFDPGRERLRNIGFDPGEHSVALRQVLMSNCIQHGTYWGSEVFKEAEKLSGQPLGNMSDADIIYWVYQVKLTDLSWSNGCPDPDRPGMLPEWAERRWNAEREDALEMLRCE